MLRKLAVYGAVVGFLSAPTTVNAQPYPCTGISMNACQVFLARYGIPAAQMALNWARCPNCAATALKQVAPSIVGGAAALGGPLSPNSTPAYCRRGKCYDSNGKPLN